MRVQTVTASSDHTVSQEDITAVERLLAELRLDHSPKLAVVAHFMLAFRMFRDLDNRFPDAMTRRGPYETVLNGLLFIGGCLEDDVATVLEDVDLEKVGSSRILYAAVMRYLRERYQLWFGLRDDEAASRFIEGLETLQAA